jgi:hypothetical protein
MCTSVKGRRHESSWSSCQLLLSWVSRPWLWGASNWSNDGSFRFFMLVSHFSKHWFSISKKIVHDSRVTFTIFRLVFLLFVAVLRNISSGFSEVGFKVNVCEILSVNLLFFICSISVITAWLIVKRLWNHKTFRKWLWWFEQKMNRRDSSLLRTRTSCLTSHAASVDFCYRMNDSWFLPLF